MFCFFRPYFSACAAKAICKFPVEILKTPYDVGFSHPRACLFSKFWHTRYRTFVIKWWKKIPPHLKSFATLPYEILMSVYEYQYFTRYSVVKRLRCSRSFIVILLQIHCRVTAKEFRQTLAGLLFWTTLYAYISNHCHSVSSYLKVNILPVENTVCCYWEISVFHFTAAVFVCFNVPKV